ncbi:MAG: hypothetical protein R2794_06530 [Chitinophagales bacterium]
MQRVSTLIVLFLFGAAGILSAQNYQFDSVGWKDMTIGTMEIKGDAWVIRVQVGGHDQDFWPMRLPENVMQQGQKVVFSGALGRVPLNVRLSGTPIDLRMIRVLYTTRPPETDKQNGEVMPNEKAPDKAGFDSVGYIQEAIGKVMRIDETWLIALKEADGTKRYIPDFLPDELKVEGMEIQFSGAIGRIDPNVRMMGTPLHVHQLAQIETIQMEGDDVQEDLRPYLPFDSIASLHQAAGVIKLFDAETNLYILEVDNGRNDITRYIPISLPEAFRRDGMQVIVSGNICAIPANVRMAGRPIEILEIGEKK